LDALVWGVTELMLEEVDMPYFYVQGEKKKDE